ncbi:lipopolysaccharide biosynthesis protein [Pontiella agarivorans]|uniref:Lipopolysaccharide biosynthesis protein n=1 Tax=Pontiella agarivorans TaxID=3038953 RepID=A0ABU5MSZ9_9BACT|nr:lipopolysaccharide biosynthesis protein [Pontiella agarivorans]MDZ8117325.1 lipopolysaccharide biosynthesis protein [Pontiella agarivorans]
MTLSRLFSNSFFSILAKLFNALVQVICLPVLLRVFGKEDYGLIVIATTLNTFIAIIQFGLPTGIPKFVAEWLAKKEYNELESSVRTIVSFYILLGVINGLILITVAIFGISLFNVSSNQVQILRLLLMITAITSLLSMPATVLDQLLTGAHELAFVSKMQMVKNLSQGILVALVYFRSEWFTVPMFYGIQCGLFFLMLPGKVWCWSKHADLKVLLPGLNVRSVLPLLKYCISVFAFFMFMMIAKKLTPVVLAVRVNENVGLVLSEFQIINYIHMFLMMIAGSFTAALVPFISGATASGDSKMYQNTMVQGTKYIWAFGALCGFGIIMLSREVIAVYVGVEYMHLSLWLTVHIFASLYNLYNPAMSSVVLSSGILMPLVIVTALGAIVSILCCWWLAPVYGVGSVSIALLANNVISFLIMNFWYYPKYFHLKPFAQFFQVFLPPLFAGVVMVWLGQYIMQVIGITGDWMRIGFGAAIGAIVYTSLILILYIHPAEVKNLIFRLKPSSA